MENFKIIYTGKNVSITPFDENNHPMNELNDCLLGYLNSFSKPFEIDVEINEEKGKIIALSLNSTIEYSDKITNELEEDLVSLIITILQGEDLLTPLISTICYDKENPNDLLDE